MVRMSSPEELRLVERFLESVATALFGSAWFRVINFHVRKNRGKSLAELMFENPREASYTVLAIIGGGKTQARLLENIFRNHLEKNIGGSINEDLNELFEAIIKNDAKRTREKLVKIAQDYIQVRLRRL